MEGQGRKIGGEEGKMNTFERLMLDNCRILFRYLWLKEENYTSGDGPLLIEQANKIEEALKEKEISNEPCCDMDAEESMGARSNGFV